MSKKKNYTLEIILVTMIILVAFFSITVRIKRIKRNEVKNELSKITEKILVSTETYIKTDKNLYDQIYNNKNNITIKLKTLINEEFLEIPNKIKDKDIEKDYITLEINTEYKKEDCIKINTRFSWNLKKYYEISICENSIIN